MNGLSFMKVRDIRLNISVFSYLSGHELTILEIPFPVCVQRPKKWLVRGLVKFVTAVARLVCLNLLG